MWWDTLGHLDSLINSLIIQPWPCSIMHLILSTTSHHHHTNNALSMTYIHALIDPLQLRPAFQRLLGFSYTFVLYSKNA